MITLHETLYTTQPVELPQLPAVADYTAKVKVLQSADPVKSLELSAADSAVRRKQG